MRVPTAATAVLEYDSIARAPRVLLVGEAPARDSRKSGLEWALVLKSISMPRPWAIAKIPEREAEWIIPLTRKTQHGNLLAKWPGHSGRGSSFPVEEAGHEMKQLIAALESGSHGYKVVLLAGKRLGALVGMRDYLKWGTLGGIPCAVVPHPSGVNRHWSSKRECKRVARFLQDEVYAARVHVPPGWKKEESDAVEA